MAVAGVPAATSAQGDGGMVVEPGETFSMDADYALCHDEATKKMLAEEFSGALHSMLPLAPPAMASM